MLKPYGHIQKFMEIMIFQKLTKTHFGQYLVYFSK